MRLRAPTRNDAGAVLDVILARDVADVGEPDYDLEDLLDEWAAEGFVLDADAVVAEDGDGGIVGYAAMRADEAHAYVHPDHERRGIGAALVAWTERRAAERGHDRHRQTVGERNARGKALLESRGYALERSYWRMVIDLGAVAPEAPPPAGVTARALDPAADAEALYAINERAFAAVNSYRGEPLERFAEEHLRAASLDPALSVVAESGGAPVAFALCRRWEESARGYVDLLAVDPDAAGRGIGSWLLAEVFARCRAAGLRQAMLGVASDNPRAAELYERAGMRVLFRLDSYERAVDPA